MEESLSGRITWWKGRELMEASFGLGHQELKDGFSIMLSEEIADDVFWQVVCNSESEVTLHSLTLTQVVPVMELDRIFINGYQSWTESRLFSRDESIPKLRTPFARLLNTTGDYTFQPNSGTPGDLHSWSITSITDATGATRFWSDTAPETGYVIFEWHCKSDHLVIKKDVGGHLLKGRQTLLHVHAWRESGTEMSRLPLLPDRQTRSKAVAPATGWTSWYNYYTKITEEIILSNLAAFGNLKVPIDFFQIDDGWQPAVGDWTSANEKFPQGMAYLAAKIHASGYKAGLWLAPLIVEKDSTIYRDHREWLVTHDGEHLVEAGYNPGWGGLIHGVYYLLDLENSEVRAHLRHVFDIVLRQWNYDLVKLDFLFAAALIPRNGKSRGELMAEASTFLRECCGDKLILGCGVPLAPAWGKFDYCRIGPDIGLNWDMKSAKMIHMRERISTRNAIRNTIHRRHFSGRCFANDPDVFILRAEHHRLLPHQQHSLWVINQIFGDLLFTSDDIQRYDEKTLRRYRSAFPALPHKIRKVEQLGELYKIWFEVPADEKVPARRYFVLSNVGKAKCSSSLPSGHWFRDGEGMLSELSIALEPYETQVFLELDKTVPGICGSDLHLFPGSEVAELEMDGGGIKVVLSPKCLLSGTLFVAVPDGQPEVLVNGTTVRTFGREGFMLVALKVTDGKLL